MASFRISGAKNAALPLMIASLLSEDTVRSRMCRASPTCSLLLRILGNHGVDYSIDGKPHGDLPTPARPCISTPAASSTSTAPYDLVSHMRASFWVVAPLLARMGEAKVSLPGGCAIGTRPVDLLLMALEKLGAYDRHRSGLCHRQGAEGAQRRRNPFSQSDGRRHPYRA